MAEINKFEDVSNKSNERRKFSPNICRFFASRGYCSFGENCRFSHSKPVREERQRPRTFFNSPTVRNTEASFSRSNYNFNPVDHFSIIVSEATPEKLYDLRNRDISALKRLYPNFSAVDENVFHIDFSPTDPDWPFDVKLITIRIECLPDYPSKNLSLKVIGPDLLPEILISHINANVDKHLSETFDDNQNRKGRYFLLLRPVLKFLDKNIRTYFVEGLKKVRLDMQAKAAGITFVPPPKKQEAEPLQESGDEDDPIDESAFCKSDNEETTDETVSVSTSRDEASTKADIELRFTNMELVANVATLEAKKLSFVVQCLRCKHKSDFIWCSKVKTPAARACQKCHLNHCISFQPAQIHQYSSQIGWLNTEGLVPFDLVLLPSEFKVVCLNCNECTTRAGLSWGQSEIFWCHKCHTKVEFKLHGSKFHGINKTVDLLTDQPTAGSTSAKIKKLPKEPALQEGKPLPDMGTCKHYKKSFRWFRFPCCGKLYPCDLCHEDGEDHEIKFANRIVCGYCSKEQPCNSNKLCTSCSNYVTKVTTAHWENGRGCRDPTKMSTRDRQKYKNKNKTISNRALQQSKK